MTVCEIMIKNIYLHSSKGDHAILKKCIYFQISSDLTSFASCLPSAPNLQFFLTLGQNKFCNKITFMYFSLSFHWSVTNFFVLCLFMLQLEKRSKHTGTFFDHQFK